VWAVTWGMLCQCISDKMHLQVWLLAVHPGGDTQDHALHMCLPGSLERSRCQCAVADTSLHMPHNMWPALQGKGQVAGS
jgi:hypothetical protein